MNYQTGTLYVFIEQQSENLVARTADIRELKKIMQSDFIAIGEPLLIKDNRYNIKHIVIEPMSEKQEYFSPNNDGYDLGQPAYWTVHTRIYLSLPKK